MVSETTKFTRELLLLKRIDSVMKPHCIGASGWSGFQFLFFDQVGILHGVKNGRF